MVLTRSWKILVLILASLSMVGCASTKKPPEKRGERTNVWRKAKTGTSDSAEVAYDKTKSGVGDAVLAPAEDLNLKREKIPPLLEAIQSPYDPIPSIKCSRLSAMISDLDAVLGPDADALTEKQSRSQRAGEGVADATLSTVSGVARSVIPFRSLVRRATGATRWERKVLAAYERGLERRAYLKGVGLARGCKPPAAPIRRK